MKFNEDLSKIHADLCGDGCVSKSKDGNKHKYYRIDFRNTNLNLLKDFQDRFYNYFEIKPKNYNNERTTVHSKKFYYLLTNEFGSFYSRKWKMPNLSKNNSRYWLRAFYDCEGWVELKKAKSRTIGLECINEKGIKSIQKSLLKFEIDSSLKYKKERGIWRLRICGLNDIKKFSKYIGFLHPNKSRKLNEVLNSYKNYNWEIPKSKKDLLELIKIKGKNSKDRDEIKIHTIKLKNLLNLKRVLRNYKIKSKIYGPWKNQYGSINYYLVLNKRDLPNP